MKERAVLVAGLLALVSISLAQASLTDGLVAYWPLDEGSGSTAFDAAGTNDGTISGGAAYTSTGIAPTPGNVAALAFDGVDDLVTVPHAAALDMTAAYTIAAWVNIASEYFGTYQSILSRADTSSSDIEVYWSEGGQGLTIAHNRNNTGAFGFVYLADPPIGSLFHLAVVFDGATIRAYYDGIAAAVNKVVPGPSVPAPLATNKGWQIGRVETVDSHPFKGSLDEVYLYNRALSASEVAALAGTDNFTCEDTDGDGEADATDACPDTPTGEEVDQAGYSLTQFCAAINATTTQGAQICKNSDWQNDEPLAELNKGDCRVQKGNPGRADDLCVPKGNP